MFFIYTEPDVSHALVPIPVSKLLEGLGSPGRFWSTREKKKTQLSLQRSKVRRAVFEEVCTMDVICVELQ